ncbi:hypothetical protein D3C78_1695730 [compost metagenome]
MRDRLVRVVLVGEAAGKDDVTGDAVAFGEAVDVLVRFGRAHVVDAQVDGRADLGAGQHAEGRHPAGGIHQGGDGAAVNHAIFRIAHDGFAIRQAQCHSLGFCRNSLDTEQLTMAQNPEKTAHAL